MIYIAYCILLLSDNFRKGPAESMNSNGKGEQPLAMQATSTCENQVLISRAKYLTFALKMKTKKVR